MIQVYELQYLDSRLRFGGAISVDALKHNATIGSRKLSLQAAMSVTVSRWVTSDPNRFAHPPWAEHPVYQHNRIYYLIFQRKNIGFIGSYHNNSPYFISYIYISVIKRSECSLKVFLIKTLTYMRIYSTYRPCVAGLSLSWVTLICMLISTKSICFFPVQPLHNSTGKLIG